MPEVTIHTEVLVFDSKCGTDVGDHLVHTLGSFSYSIYKRVSTHTVNCLYNTQ